MRRDDDSFWFWRMLIVLVLGPSTYWAFVYLGILVGLID
jgi:hypothetical protein